ncbi:hypothetical protein [Neisseria sicca]|nr:hypothetical protein [Neisseria sicca]
MSIWADMTAGARGRLKAGLCFQTTSFFAVTTLLFSDDLTFSTSG